MSRFRSHAGLHPFVLCSRPCQGLDGLAVGIPVFMARMPWRTAVAAMTFAAAMTPVGIGIGLAATESTHGTVWDAQNGNVSVRLYLVMTVS